MWQLAGLVQHGEALPVYMVPGQERWMTDLLKTQDRGRYEGEGLMPTISPRSTVFIARVMELKIIALSPLETEVTNSMK